MCRPSETPASFVRVRQTFPPARQRRPLIPPSAPSASYATALSIERLTCLVFLDSFSSSVAAAWSAVGVDIGGPCAPSAVFAVRRDLRASDAASSLCPPLPVRRRSALTRNFCPQQPDCRHFLPRGPSSRSRNGLGSLRHLSCFRSGPWFLVCFPWVFSGCFAGLARLRLFFLGGGLDLVPRNVHLPNDMYFLYFLFLFLFLGRPQRPSNLAADRKSIPRPSLRIQNLAFGKPGVLCPSSAAPHQGSGGTNSFLRRSRVRGPRPATSILDRRRVAVCALPNITPGRFRPCGRASFPASAQGPSS